MNRRDNPAIERPPLQRGSWRSPATGRRRGFGFPKEERAGPVVAHPDTFLRFGRSDERYHGVRARLAALDGAEPETVCRRPRAHPRADTIVVDRHASPVRDDKPTPPMRHATNPPTTHTNVTGYTFAGVLYLNPRFCSPTRGSWPAPADPDLVPVAMGVLLRFDGER